MNEIQYSEWVELGKQKGFHDYYKDMVRITVKNEVLLELLQVFNDYEVPITMTAEDVREIINKLNTSNSME